MNNECPHDETDHGICIDCGKQTDTNAHDYVDEEDNVGSTGPHGLKLGDYERPVWDGPQPRTRPVSVPNNLPLNSENAGE